MRIGIVNDVVLAREALRRVVAWSTHEVAWLAPDGAKAIELAASDKPDLILMDLIMPGVDGVEATRRIIAQSPQSPCPILVVTASVSGHLGRVYEAMGLGALDAVDTPALGDPAGAAILLEKIATIAKFIGMAPRPSIARPVPIAPSPIGRNSSWPIVAIGASTGGPVAIAEVLSGLPDTRDAAVVIAQHVDAAFGPGLARWLTERTGRKVELITPGDRPLPGRVLLGSTNDHVILDESGRLDYASEPVSNYYRPSGDVLFESLARHWPERGVAVVLTGMGRDGASGLLTLRRAGWLTLAQDEATCVVWGMPRAAAEIGAAMHVLPLSEIAQAITERVRGRSHQLPGEPRR